MMKNLLFLVILVSSGSAFADQMRSKTNVSVASCCDSCYLSGTAGAVPCTPGLEKTGKAAPTTTYNPATNIVSPKGNN